MPPLLAVDLERGWMLMADAGDRLREFVERERDLACWLDMLPLYAGLQIDLADHADELVALGVPDLRLAALPSRFEQLLDESRSSCRQTTAAGSRRTCRGCAKLCEELAGFGLPETIQHDDFHDGQVFVRTAATSCSTGATRASPTRSSRCR